MQSKLITGAALLLAAAGAATAQQVEVEKIIGGCPTGQEGAEVRLQEIGSGQFEILLAAQPEARVQTFMTMIQKDEDHEYKVEVRGEDVKAWIDGERLSKDRIKITDRQIVLLGKDGKAVAEFSRSIRTPDVPTPPRGGMVFERVRPGQDAIIWNDENGQPMRPSRDAPPVMIGINMAQLDIDDDRLEEVLAEHDLDSDEVVHVAGVIDGLPADEAGLREGDVILALDGEWGVDTGRLREVLNGKEPGDELEVSVFRDGRVREFTLELAAYDPQQLGVPAAPMAPEAPFMLRGGPDQEEIKSLVEELTRKLEGATNPEELREEIEKMTRELRQLQQTTPGTGLRLDVLPRLSRPGGPEQRLFVQPAPRADGGAQDERLERIEQRLDRLENRLDRILNALEQRQNRD